MYFIYELVDPRTDVTGYVGITNNPNQRYREHLEGKEGKGKKYNWIHNIQEQQMRPKMKILEIVDDLEQARTRERYWVQYYIGKGIELKNTMLCSKQNDIKKTRTTPENEDKLNLADNYYTRNQAGKILDVNIWTFKLLLQKGRITKTFPDEQSQVGYYLKSDIDELATELATLREKYDPAGLTRRTNFFEREQ